MMRETTSRIRAMVKRTPEPQVITGGTWRACARMRHAAPTRRSTRCRECSAA